MSAALHLIYGGTFDPVHAGHLAIADAVWTALDSAGAQPLRFDWLPNADPPHRDVPGASAGQRLALLQLALLDDSRFCIDTRELDRGGPSWMIDTLRSLRAQLGPALPLVLLLGDDVWAGFDRWRQWRDIPELAHVLVVDRPHHDAGELSAELHALEASRHGVLADLCAAPAGRIVHLQVPAHPASATAVRAALAAGDSALLHQWLPLKVMQAIEARALYRPTQG
ncbi:MAG: nicotinate-nucleotide adenylyltransferase [Aquimonas sp.]|nr:nicotinate-nucleotide adenylyltransferase [Aquimonas sp.]